MDRDGPGFLTDLVIVFLTYAAIMLIADFVTASLDLEGIASTAVALVIGLAIVFVVLITYYRTFLEEAPVTGA